MAELELAETITERGIVYAVRESRNLTGSLYRPAAERTCPAIVALHGGGWRNASSTVYDHLGPWLAARGYVVFAPVYRTATPDRKAFPEALFDVRAAIQFVRGRAADFGVDPERVAVMGESAGGHLAALAALAGEDLGGAGEGGPRGEFAHLPTGVRAAIAVYGVFDLVQQWRHDLLVRPGDQQIVNMFLGTSPTRDRRVFFNASPLSYAIEKNNAVAFLVAWGTADDVVDFRTQSQVFVEALKQAGSYVRTAIIADAPHYWLGEPLDEPGSYPALFAPRLLRFLRAKV